MDQATHNSTEGIHTGIQHVAVLMCCTCFPHFTPIFTGRFLSTDCRVPCAFSQHRNYIYIFTRIIFISWEEKCVCSNFMCQLYMKSLHTITNLGHPLRMVTSPPPPPPSHMYIYVFASVMLHLQLVAAQTKYNLSLDLASKTWTEHVQVKEVLFFSHPVVCQKAAGQAQLLPFTKDNYTKTLNGPLCTGNS